MTTCWWVRHGPTHRRELNGWTEVAADLSDHAMLARLADYLPQGIPIVSSDLGRAVATADAIARGRPRLPHDPGLREIHFGAWEGRLAADIGREDPILSRRFWEEPGDIRPPGGESWNELGHRVSQAVDRLTQFTGDLIAVAHFGTILSQVQRAWNCSALEALAQPIDNLSVTRLVREGECWHAGEINHIVL